MSEQALQQVLAAEHAAMFVLSAIGGMTSRASEPTLVDTITLAHDAHRARRDQLTARLVEQQAEPEPAAASYRLPRGLDSGTGRRRAALEVEQRCAATYADAVAKTSGEDRGWMITALDETAARELSLGAEPRPFPGLDELDDR